MDHGNRRHGGFIRFSVRHHGSDPEISSERSKNIGSVKVNHGWCYSSEERDCLHNRLQNEDKA